MTPEQKEIRELKQALLKAQHDIEKLSKIKSDFVSIVSHELRTPLTSIRESVSLVLDGIAGELKEEQKNFLGIAKNNIDRLTKIIVDMLDFSKLESGSIVMHKKKMDIDDVIRSVHDIIRDSIRQKDIEFTLDLSGEKEFVWFDPERIKQVLRNLISNAVKFNKEKGRINIASCREPRNGKKVIKVSVEDTGVGLSKEDILNLFQRFSPLDSTITRSYRGIGLGLVMCKGIIELHGGDIWAESKKDVGSKFIFTLPIYKKDSEFNYLLDEAIERSRYNDMKLSLIIFGIKDKKDITENNLSDLESTMQSAVRGPEDKVVRLRKGELIAVMACTDRDGAEKIMTRIKKEIKINLNFGISIYPDRTKVKGDLVKKTEEDLKSRKYSL